MLSSSLALPFSISRMSYFYPQSCVFPERAISAAAVLPEEAGMGGRRSPDIQGKQGVGNRE